jgi:hypothetical protein
MKTGVIEHKKIFDCKAETLYWIIMNENIHSEAIGETNDPQWKTRLYSRTTPVNSIDQTQIRNPCHYGSFIDQNLRNQ